MAVTSSKRRRKAGKPGTRAPAKRTARPRAKDLDLRREPLQLRGHATFEHILDATARLLDELGLESVNTNVVAKAAGVNIATLYQYFPNKQAVLLALFQRQAQRRADTARSLFAGIGHAADWPDRIDAFVDGLASVRSELPGTTALMQAMRVDPTLREYHQRVTEQVCNELAEELVAADRLSRDQARVVVRCAIEANSALIDAWQVAFNGRDARLLGEIKLMLRRYLAPYLSEPARLRRRGTQRVRSPRAR
jgi:AcrR family transcriptional regulator